VRCHPSGRRSREASETGNDVHARQILVGDFILVEDEVEKLLSIFVQYVALALFSIWGYLMDSRLLDQCPSQCRRCLVRAASVPS
jgi:hypothetical protein